MVYLNSHYKILKQLLLNNCFSKYIIPIIYFILLLYIIIIVYYYLITINLVFIQYVYFEKFTKNGN